MLTGRVLWFSLDKGYGFLSTPSGPDVFVHIRELNNSGITGLKDGQVVEFDVGEGRAGKKCATNIRFAPKNGGAETHALRQTPGDFYINAQRRA